MLKIVAIACCIEFHIHLTMCPDGPLDIVSCEDCPVVSKVLSHEHVTKSTCSQRKDAMRKSYLKQLLKQLLEPLRDTIHMLLPHCLEPARLHGLMALR